MKHLYRNFGDDHAMFIYKEGEGADTLSELGSFLAGDEPEKGQEKVESKDTGVALEKLKEEVDEGVDEEVDEENEGKTGYKEDSPDLFTGSAEEGGLPSNGTDLYTPMEAEAPAGPEAPTKEINESREPTASQEPQEAPAPTTEEGKTDVFAKVGDAMRSAPGMAKEAIVSAGTAAVEAGKEFLKGEAKTTDKPKSEREKLTQKKLDQIVKDAKEGNTEAQARLKEIRRAYQERVAKRERQGGQSATDAATDRFNNQVASREYTGPLDIREYSTETPEAIAELKQNLINAIKAGNLEKISDLEAKLDAGWVLILATDPERARQGKVDVEYGQSDPTMEKNRQIAMEAKKDIISQLTSDDLEKLRKLPTTSVQKINERSLRYLAEQKLAQAKIPESNAA